MSRTAALAIVALLVLTLGVLALRRPAAAPALSCSPDQVEWVDAGTAFIARCASGPTGSVPAGVALTLGRKLDLNRATDQELGTIPGLGPSVARALVSARGDAGFRDWSSVEQVRGVGPAKLELLKRTTALAP